MAVSPRSSKAGIAIATAASWGTATALGAGDGIWVIDDLNDSISMQVDEDDSAGQDFIGSMQVANHNAPKPEIATLLHYNDGFQNVMWALACGTGGTAPVQIGATTAYTNTFEPATNKTGVFATIIRDKVQYISEIPSAKCTGFELSFGDNGRAMITWMFIGAKVNIASVINTSTQVSALTFPTQGLRAFFKQLEFRLNAASGGALSSAEEMGITDLTFKYDQALDEKFEAGQDYLVQPEDNAYPEITLDVTFTRLDSVSDDFAAYHRDNTSLKADITLTGPTLATTTYKLLVQFPNLIVTAAPVEFPSGAENVAPAVSFKAYKASTAPTGMTGVTKPFRITTTGISTTNPFA